MVTVAQVIRAEKSNIKVHDWASGKIPAKLFPITNARRLKLSPNWKFRVVTFEALGRKMSVLIKLNLQNQEYSAILACCSEAVARVLCHHELHGSHRAFHCHFARGEIDDVYAGVLRDTSSYRQYERPSERENFSVTEETALTIALRRFRIDPVRDKDPNQSELFA